MNRRVAITLALFLILSLWNTPAKAGPLLDYDTESGHFYTQAGGRPSGDASVGFEISDADDVAFWTAYRNLGGPAILGYPISKRFRWPDGVYQATQKALLRWDSTTKEIHLVNLMDQMGSMGRNEWMREGFLIPPPNDDKSESGLSPEAIRAARMKHLDGNEAIKATYASVPNPDQVFGLPTSGVVDMGQAYVMRFQKNVIYQWKEDFPWARARTTAIGQSGDVFKQGGYLPADSVVPENAPPPSRQSQTSRGGERPAEGLTPSTGIATWYGAAFHGRRMSNGEIYNMNDPDTTASNAYPLGTWLRVTHRETGASVVVRVTDHGAFRYPIIVDLSMAAFNKLANPMRGVIPVTVEPVVR